MYKQFLSSYEDLWRIAGDGSYSQMLLSWCAWWFAKQPWDISRTPVSYYAKRTFDGRAVANDNWFQPSSEDIQGPSASLCWLESQIDLLSVWTYAGYAIITWINIETRDSTHVHWTSMWKHNSFHRIAALAGLKRQSIIRFCSQKFSCVCPCWAMSLYALPKAFRQSCTRSRFSMFH